MPKWLQLYFETVQWYNSLDGNEREQAEQLFYFGRRRCQTLFGSSAPKISVAFGLCKVDNFVRVLPGAEDRIAWMRRFLAPFRSKHPHLEWALIRYYPDTKDNLENWRQSNKGRVFFGDRACTHFEAAATFCQGMTASNEDLIGDESDEESDDPGHGAPADKNTNFRATISRGQKRRMVEKLIEENVHVLHPDSRTPESVAEYATLQQSLNADRTTSHKRWVPANENKDIFKPGASEFQCPWDLVGFSSPLSASVNRAQSLQGLTGEDCGLYRTAELTGGDNREYFPQLNPTQPRTWHDLSAEGMQTFEEATLQLSSGSTKRPGSFKDYSPRKKRKTTDGGGCPSKCYIRNLEESINEDQSYVRKKSLFGIRDIAAVLLPPWAEDKTTVLPAKLEIDYVISEIEAGLFSAASLSEILDIPVGWLWIEKQHMGEADKAMHTKAHSDEVAKSLKALVKAAKVYRDLPNSKIDIGVTSQPLASAKYLESSTSMLADKFSCIAFFESGIINIDPKELNEVMAISSGNSLHIAACCLQDPAQDESMDRTLHTIGNVGKPGLCFLFSPKTPMVQEPGRDQWQVVRHLLFDGEFESNFESATSIHLSFTGYEFPVQTADHGGLDRDAFFVEAAVRVFDGREWVADIDIISAFRRLNDTARRLGTCNHFPQEKERFQHLNLTSVDSWIELVDAPTTAHVVRAKNDWISRLAAFAIATQTRRSVLITSGSVCWRCVEELATTFLKFNLSEESSWRLGLKEDWFKLMILC